LEIKSEAASVVADIKVQVGDRVHAGQILIVTELMKMQQEHKAPANASVTSLPVNIGDVLEPGSVMVVLEQLEAAPDAKETATPSTEEQSSQNLDELNKRLEATGDAARPQMVEKRHALGNRTARENIADLFDEGSFREYGALAVAAQRLKHDEEALLARSPADGIITGIGKINGKSVVAMVVDYSVMAGTQGYFHHKKMDRILEVAARRSLPVVLFAEGGGGRPNDTDTVHIHPAGLDIGSFKAFAALSGKVPRIAIVNGYCFAGNAAFAGTADLIIATKNSWLGMGGPAMIEGGGLGTHKPTEIGPSDIQHQNGVIDILVGDEAQATAACKQILTIIAGDIGDVTEVDNSGLRSIIPENRQMAYRSADVVTQLLDAENQIELRAGFGIGISTWLGSIAGRPVGLMANNPLHLGGAIDPDAADKAAHFMQFCNCFGLPIISLIDTPGFMVGPEIEKQAQVRHVSRMFVTAAALTVPLMSVITRKAYGLGAMAMAGGSLHASDFTIAWPTGEIGAMGLEGAVTLGHKAELEAINDDKARQARYNELVANLYTRGKAIAAGSKLEFDAVIDPAQTRDWIVSAIDAAGEIEAGERGFLDVW